MFQKCVFSFLFYYLGCNSLFYFIYQYSDYYNKYHIIPQKKLDLVPKKNINELSEELNKSKKTIEQLNNKIKELNNKFNSENKLNLNKIQSLQSKINQKDEELNKLKEILNNNIEKNKYKILEDKVKELNKELSDKENRIKELINNKKFENIPENKFDSKEELYKIIIEKDREIKELKLKLSRYPMELKEGEKLMTVNFTTVDSKIKYYSIICKNTDIFNTIEKKLYEDYNEYYDTENYFTVNEKKINRFKNLEENNIHNNDVIILNIIKI